MQTFTQIIVYSSWVTKKYSFASIIVASKMFHILRVEGEKGV